MKINLISFCTVFALLYGDFALADKFDPNVQSNRSVSTDADKCDTDSWLKAAEQGDFETIKSLTKKGIDKNCQDKGSNTALMRVVKSTAIKDVNVKNDIVKFLLENKADPNIKDRLGNTPLMSAAAKGYTNIAKMLVKNGADVNVQGKYGSIALHSAALGGRTEIVKLLLENGANVNATNKYSDTALQNAVSGGHVEVAELLIKSGADVKAKNKYGSTALQRVISTKMIKDDAIRVKLVKTLLDKKADPSSINNEGQTPMSLAQAKKRLASNSEKKQTWLKIIQMLKDAGATE